MKSKSVEEILKETTEKLDKKREPLNAKDLKDLTEEKYQVARNPGGHYLVDKKGQVIAAARKRQHILEAKRRLEEREKGIEHKSVDILKKG